MNVIDWLKAQADKLPSKFRGALYALLAAGALAALVFPEEFQDILDQVNLASEKVGKTLATVVGLLALLKLTPDAPKGDGGDGDEFTGEDLGDDTDAS